MKDVNPGGNSMSPVNFTEAGNTVFLGGSDEQGAELFKLAANPPDLTLKAAKQKLAKKLAAEVGCDEDCTVTVTGTVKAKSKKRKGKGKKVLVKTKSFALEGSTVEVDAGETEMATPSFKAKDFRKASKLLKKGGKLKASLIAAARDGANNITTAGAKVKLK